MNKIATPETDKMIAVKDKSQAIGAFLEWLNNENTVIVRYATKDDERDEKGNQTGIHEGDYLPFHISIEKMLAKYFKIDLDKAEQEKRALLESIRKIDISKKIPVREKE